MISLPSRQNHPHHHPHSLSKPPSFSSNPSPTPPPHNSFFVCTAQLPTDPKIFWQQAAASAVATKKISRAPPDRGDRTLTFSSTIPEFPSQPFVASSGSDRLRTGSAARYFREGKSFHIGGQIWLSCVCVCLGQNFAKMSNHAFPGKNGQLFPVTAPSIEPGIRPWPPVDRF